MLAVTVWVVSSRVPSLAVLGSGCRWGPRGGRRMSLVVVSGERCGGRGGYRVRQHVLGAIIGVVTVRRACTLGVPGWGWCSGGCVQLVLR